MRDITIELKDNVTNIISIIVGIIIKQKIKIYLLYDVGPHIIFPSQKNLLFPLQY